MRRGRMVCAQLLAFVFALAVFAVTATACEGGGGEGAELTSLSTKLTGGGKEGETITVSEGTKVKDKATLTGKNASKATGKVTYKIYSDKECKTLVKSAGEVTVSGESVPASSEEELEGGKAYYWQAHYGGDSKNAESTSPCTEILDVQATTSLSTRLSGESKEGAELTVLEGAKVKDKATVEGTNSSTAEGKVLYKIYSDNKCEALVGEAGEKSVSSGAAAASNEEELAGGKSYYWRATYKGDSLHQESTSPCTEILNVKAKTTLTTSLSGEGKELEELTVLEGVGVKDKATLSGTNSATAGGKLLYKLFSDNKCESPVKEAGEVTVSSGSVPASTEEEPEGGKTYYWQAIYKGDALHQESRSTCGAEILHVKAKTSVATTLSGEGHEGEEITILEGSKVKDKATLSGTNSATAGGKLLYKLFSDNKCESPVKEAGEVTVSSGSVPASTEEEPEGGKTYYWQAIYKGDALHQESRSTCGAEILHVKAKTTITTSLSGEGQEGGTVEAQPGSPVEDSATLHGSNAESATGTVSYSVYSDEECKVLVAEAGSVSVSGGAAPASSAQTLPTGTYYWKASYSGDSLHEASHSTCGSEVLTVKTATNLTTTLSGEGQTGQNIAVAKGQAISDDATLSGENAATASGTVKYAVYSDKECKELVTSAGEVSVTAGMVPSSIEETLAAGTYYWQATYSGDSANQASTSACGSEISIVSAEEWLMTAFSGEAEPSESEELSALPSFEAAEGKPIVDTATLHGEEPATATGTVKYKVYSDNECTELVTSAGEVGVSGGKIPSSSEVTLSKGIYYWQASYSGDEHHSSLKSPCGAEVSVVRAATSLSTSLSAEGHSSESVTVSEATRVSDEATLSGSSASTATGTVTYDVYSNSECTTLAATAGTMSVSSGTASPSQLVNLPAGKYYWQASYSGDEDNAPSESTCGSEIMTVKKTTLLETELTSGAQAGGTVAATPETGITDHATLTGAGAASASGTVTYKIYSESKCETLATEAGTVTVTSGSVPASSEEKLSAGTYYWQASYSGDSENAPSVSECGSEISVVSSTAVTMTLASTEESGASIEVLEGVGVTATATLTSAHSSSATGTVTYKVYSDSKCETLATEAGKVTVSSGSVPASSEEKLPAGTYYWQASYSGNAENSPGTSICGIVQMIVQVAARPPLEQVHFLNPSLPVIVDHPVDKNGAEEPEKQLSTWPVPGEDTVQWKTKTRQPKISKNWPVAYVQGKTPQLEAKFSPNALTRRLVNNGTIEEAIITGKTSILGKALEVEPVTITNATLRTQVAGANGKIETGPTTMTEDLPKENGYEKITITWEWRLRIGGVLGAAQPLGQSTHNFYVLYKEPAGIPNTFAERGGMYLTILDIASKGKIASSRAFTKDESDTIGGVWDGLTNRVGGAGTPLKTVIRNYEPAKGTISEGNVMRYWPERVLAPISKNLAVTEANRNQIPLVISYYLTKPKPGRALPGSLYSTSGECKTWAELLVGALSYEGIKSSRVLITPRVIQIWPGLRIAVANRFLVKNWTFNKPNPGEANTFGEVTRAAGAVAQGQENPWAFFGNHVITLIENAETGRNELYDASYGLGPFTFNRRAPNEVTATPLTEYQESALAGFCFGVAAGGTCRRAAVGERLIDGAVNVPPR